MGAVMDKDIKDLKVLFDEKSVSTKTAEIAEQINKDFGEKDDLTVICVLKGSSIFCCDLIKHLKMPVQLEFIKVSSYGNGQVSSGNVKALDLTLPSLKHKNVIIVEDIIDTGCTLKFLVDMIKNTHCPEACKIVTFLNKKIARKIHIEPDYFGYEVDDKFVVGYGLDYDGYFRNLPYIGYFPN